MASFGQDTTMEIGEKLKVFKIMLMIIIMTLGDDDDETTQCD